MKQKTAFSVLATQMRIIKQLLNLFNREGTRGLVAIEGSGVLAVTEQRLSDVAITSLLIQLAKEHPDAFAHALESIGEMEETHEVPEGETVH